MIDLGPVGFDREKKTVSVRNNQVLYQVIDSGAVLAIVPPAVEAAAGVDPALACGNEFLDPALQAVSQYYFNKWTVIFVVTSEASTTTATASTITATANATTK